MAELNVAQIVAVLRRCELFLGLDDSELEKIAHLPSCREAFYTEDTIISQQGQVATYLCVLLEGKVDLFITLPVGTPAMTSYKTKVDSITQGGIFNWSALVSPHILTLTTVAAEPSRVLLIKGEELLGLLRTNKHIGYEVLASLVRIIGIRLREIQHSFVALTRQQDTGI